MEIFCYWSWDLLNVHTVLIMWLRFKLHTRVFCFLEMSKVHTVLSQTWEREFELTHTGIIYWKIQSSAMGIYCQVFKTNSQARQKFAE